MDSGQAHRLAKIERGVGLPLPSAYASFLGSEVASARHGHIAAANGNDWDVRHVFELGSGPDHLQVDQTYALVSDVIPENSIPIADDEGGNFYLLNCKNGEVVWWNHERDLNDGRVEIVAPSFEQFLASIELDD